MQLSEWFILELASNLLAYTQVLILLIGLCIVVCYSRQYFLTLQNHDWVRGLDRGELFLLPAKCFLVWPSYGYFYWLYSMHLHYILLSALITTFHCTVFLLLTYTCLFIYIHLDIIAEHKSYLKSPIAQAYVRLAMY